MARMEHTGVDRRETAQGTPEVGRRRSDVIELIRLGLQQVVDAIPNQLTSNVLSSPLGGNKAEARARRRLSRRAQYRPRVLYRVRKPAPKRNPLPETESKVYAFLAKRPDAPARDIQQALNLRDGQLWGAIRRLTLSGLITTKAA